MYSLYLLMDPETSEDRYVGYSVDPMRRYGDHLSSRGACHRVNWILNLASRGLKPVLKILVVVDTVEEVKRLEVALIAKLRNRGDRLVNGTDGGEGLKGFKFSEKSRAEMSNSRWGGLNPMFGRRGEDSPQFGRKRSEATREKMRTTWALRKKRSGFQEKPADPRTLREKRQYAVNARWSRPGARERQSLLAQELNTTQGKIR